MLENLRTIGQNWTKSSKQIDIPLQQKIGWNPSLFILQHACLEGEKKKIIINNWTDSEEPQLPTCLLSLDTHRERPRIIMSSSFGKHKPLNYQGKFIWKHKYNSKSKRKYIIWTIMKLTISSSKFKRIEESIENPNSNINFSKRFTFVR